MRFFLVALIVSISASFAIARDLGKPLPYKLKTTGQPAFGMVYSYDNDPDGLSYLLTYTANVSASEGAKTLRWNFYLNSSDSYLLNWSEKRTVSLAVFQFKADEQIINKLLIGQKKVSGNNELSLVLADNNNTPVYHIPISNLCEEHPDQFHDLTHGKKCDEISP